MIRCPAMQCNLATSNTCDARLAWLERYEKKGMRPINALGHMSAKERYQEYILCRKCHGIEVKEKVVVKKVADKSKGQPRKWTEPCTVCGNPKINAHGMCGACYQRTRYKKKKIEDGYQDPGKRRAAALPSSQPAVQPLAVKEIV